MAYAMDWKKILILFALLLAPLALANCGLPAENNSASSTVGPVGPTFPSKYYFDFTASSIVVQSGGSVAFTVRVWDSNGNMAGGVSNTFTGSGKWENPTTTTDLNGMDRGILTVEGGAGTIDYVTVTVENLSLTIPVQIVAGTSSK